MAKLNEEKCREMAKIQEDLNMEKEKNLLERDRNQKYEKQIEELNQEIKFANKEKNMALCKAKEAVKFEMERIRNEAYNVNPKLR